MPCGIENTNWSDRLIWRFQVALLLPKGKLSPREGMSIFVTDRQSIERGFLVRSAYALISIRDPGVRRAKIPKSTALRGVLRPAIHDDQLARRMRTSTVKAGGGMNEANVRGGCIVMWRR